jgi:hypothetical protein
VILLFFCEELYKNGGAKAGLSLELPESFW